MQIPRNPVSLTLAILSIIYVVAEEKLEEQRVKPLSGTQVYADLKQKLASIKKSCGKVCDTNIDGPPGKYYNVLTKDVDCTALFTNPDIDEPSRFSSPPMKIPKYLHNDFLFDGKLKLMENYRDDSQGVTHLLEWTEELFKTLKKRYDENTLRGPYGNHYVDMISDMLDTHMPVKDKTVLVIGSQTPWIETILLTKGAKHITTFDYVKIKSHNPKVEVLTPDELSRKYLDDKVQFDTMITFSSLEHSGLGRYGDMLNPWGDLISMARAWCLVKPGGIALVGVPSGTDIVMFNSHKLYGPIGYSHLFANWEQVYTDNDFSKFNESGCDFCYQPLHVLQRKPIPIDLHNEL